MRIIQVVFLFFITLFCFESTFASKNPQTLTLSDLELEISTTKQEFLLLEPIGLTIKLRNKFGQPIIAENLAEISSKDVQALLFISDKKKSKIPISDSISNKLSSEEFSTTEKLLSYYLIPGRSEFASTPNEYRMQIIIKSGKEKLESNLLTIKIVEPLGIDKQVYDELKAFPNFSTLIDISGISEDSNLTDELYRIATHFPTSIYANFIMFNLAETHFSLGNYTLASSYFEQILTSDKDFPFLGIILEHLQDINTTLGDDAKASYYSDGAKDNQIRKDMIVYF